MANMIQFLLLEQLEGENYKHCFFKQSNVCSSVFIWWCDSYVNHFIFLTILHTLLGSIYELRLKRIPHWRGPLVSHFKYGSCPTLSSAYIQIPSSSISCCYSLAQAQDSVTGTKICFILNRKLLYFPCPLSVIAYKCFLFHGHSNWILILLIINKYRDYQ